MAVINGSGSVGNTKLSADIIMIRYFAKPSVASPIHSFIHSFIILMFPLEYRASVRRFVSLQFRNLTDYSVLSPESY